MSEKPITPAPVGMPVAPGQPMSPELAQHLQSLRDAIRDLRERVAALEP